MCLSKARKYHRKRKKSSTLFTTIFSFTHNVSKSCIFKSPHNLGLFDEPIIYLETLILSLHHSVTSITFQHIIPFSLLLKIYPYQHQDTVKRNLQLLIKDIGNVSVISGNVFPLKTCYTDLLNENLSLICTHFKLFLMSKCESKVLQPINCMMRDIALHRECIQLNCNETWR